MSAANIGNPIASPAVTTTYTVTVTDGNGFTATDNISVHVNPILKASAEITDPILTKGGTAKILISPASGTPPYTFYFQGKSSNQTGLFTGITGTEEGTEYKWSVTDALNCATTSGTITVIEPSTVENNLKLKSGMGIEGTMGEQTYSVAGTYTFSVPPGVTIVTVECWGGGGAGGGNTTDRDGGGGGGGGGYSKSTFTGLTPGATYTVNVGAGGNGGTGNGADGGDTWVGSNTTIRAKGGTGGDAPNNGNGGVNGIGGSAANGIGTTKYSGGNGGTGRDHNNGRGGGGGASAGTAANGAKGGDANNNAGNGGNAPAGGGDGGDGGGGGQNGRNGSYPGGGGGGAGDETNGNNNRTGGNGADGQVNITWEPPYVAQFTAMSIGSNTWCAGETRNVTVTVKNIGSGIWTDASPDVNIGVKWNGDPDYLVRVNAGGLAPGATQTYTLTVTAPAGGANNLTFDVVKEADCWFGWNNGSCGPGNTVYTSANITIQSTPTAGTIATDQTICYAGNPGTFTSTTNGTGSGTITYRWESNTDLVTPSWVTVPGQTGATYNVPAGLTVTTQYRRITISTLNGVACESSPTNPVQVTVQSTPTAGVIAADQTICNGGDPAAFTSTTSGTGSGTITYRWESNTNLGAPSWSTIAGQSGDTYDVPSGLTVTTRYRRITISTLNTIDCVSLPTTPVQVTVQSIPTAGVITADQTICNGGDPVAFNSTTDGGGSGTITYRWESNTNLGAPSWSAVSGATFSTYDIPAGLAVTTQYRRITISTENTVACESVPTNTVQVTVQSTTTAGAISADQTMCNGGDPAAFSSTTAGTGSGTITYRWESNTNLGAPSWSTIAGQTGSYL